MQYKKFVAPDMRAALALIKADLGADAVIVATRQLEGGVFRRGQLEVTAGLAAPAAPAPQVQRQRGAAAYAATSGARPPQANVAAGVPAASLAEADVGRAWQGEPAARPDWREPAEAPASEAHLADAQAEIASALAPLFRELRSVRASLDGRAGSAPMAALQAELGSLRHAVGMLVGTAEAGARSCPLRARLAAAEVEPALAEALATRARSRLPAGASPELREAALAAAVAERMRVGTDFFAGGAPRRLALVGPTGVGKTTTIAKIAAHAALVHDQRVALVSLDTYRMGAVEQLRAFAELIGVPMGVARDAAELGRVLADFADVDLVLVDTAGRGPADAAHRAALGALLSGTDIVTHLTLAAATRGGDLDALIAAYRPLGPTALVVTKVDEAASLGALVAAPARAGIPIALIAHGQRVPEDLALPEPAALAASLLARAQPPLPVRPPPDAQGPLAAPRPAMAASL